MVCPFISKKKTAAARSGLAAVQKISCWDLRHSQPFLLDAANNADDEDNKDADNEEENGV